MADPSENTPPPSLEEIRESMRAALDKLQSSEHLDEAERHLEESRRKLAVARELRRRSVFGG